MALIDLAVSEQEKLMRWPVYPIRFFPESDALTLTELLYKYVSRSLMRLSEYYLYYLYVQVAAPRKAGRKSEPKASQDPGPSHSSHPSG